MRKVTIFGATGMTGLCAVNAALKKGLKVRVLARDPSKFSADLRSKLEVVKGDVLRLNDVKQAVQGVDGVAIVLGTHDDLRPQTVMSEGTKNILAAMKLAGVKPVSLCLSLYNFQKIEEVEPATYREVVKDHQRMLEAARASDRDWIAVLPPIITADPSEPVEIKHGESPGILISKFDLGSFMVECLDKREHYHKLVGIAKKEYMCSLCKRVHVNK